MRRYLARLTVSLFLNATLCVLAWFWFPSQSDAQPPSAIIPVVVDPSGACFAPIPMRFNSANGKYWGCVNGAWAQVSGGGGGGTIATTPNVLKGDNAGNAVATGCTESSGVITCASFLGTGANAYINLANNTGHSVISSGDFWNNAGILNFNNGTATAHLAQVIFSGSQALGTSSIAANSCATNITVTATNALATDALTVNANADLSAVTGWGAAGTDGLILYNWLSANTVNLKVCNRTGSSITPGAVSVVLTVSR